jgi:hypothetical protein
MKENYVENNEMRILAKTHAYVMCYKHVHIH